MNKTVGIIDEPVPPGSHDNLGIDVHTESLIDFGGLLIFLYASWTVVFFIYVLLKRLFVGFYM